MTEQPRDRPTEPIPRPVFISPPLSPELRADLVAARLAARMSLRHVADRIGISAGWLSTLEQGRGAPSGPVVEALVALLDIDAGTAGRLRAAAAPDAFGTAERKAAAMRKRAEARARDAERRTAAADELRTPVAKALRELALEVEAGWQDRHLATLQSWAKGLQTGKLAPILGRGNGVVSPSRTPAGAPQSR